MFPINYLDMAARPSFNTSHNTIKELVIASAKHLLLPVT